MIVCADDFGLSEDIDEAILELCAARKLSAVSCMVVFERCSGQSMARLSAFREHADIGLHLCLTKESPALSPRKEAPALVFDSYAACVRGTLSRKANADELIAEIATQYDMFEAKYGRRPDYVDGHLHIHQAPGVMQALIEFLKKLPPNNRPYVRNTYLPLSRLKRQRLPWLKAVVIGRFGKRMAARLQATRLRTNDGFAGIYDFGRWPSFLSYLPRFVNCLDQPSGILVVHPGKRDDWRRMEYETLREFEFGCPVNRFQTNRSY